MAEPRILTQPLERVFVLDCPHYPDHRGDFTKLFHFDTLQAQGITFTPAESFLTRSRASVLRGMHFQAGEAALDKLVVCIKGRVLDVIVDVQPDSPNFNKPFAMEITEASNKALLIGKGYAHGFLSLDDDSWMFYATSKVYCSSLDQGVLWSSIAFDWPNKHPFLSDRDSRHPSIQELR